MIQVSLQILLEPWKRHTGLSGKSQDFSERPRKQGFSTQHPQQQIRNGTNYVPELKTKEDNAYNVFEYSVLMFRENRNLHLEYCIHNYRFGL